MVFIDIKKMKTSLTGMYSQLKMYFVNESVIILYVEVSKLTIYGSLGLLDM